MEKTVGNPFLKIRTIETSQELLDIAFKKAMKIKPPKERDPIIKSRVHEINRINTVSNVLTTRLEKIIINFPSLNLLHPFYTDLIEIIIDISNLKIILGRIHGLIITIKEISQDLVGELLSNDSKFTHKKIRKSAFGRFSSMIYQINTSLNKLEIIRKQLSTLPSYNPTIPCVVVCGVPNVGKSSFIKMATSGKPEIASYPFTTKKLIFGHRNFGFLQIQFVDTPGLLDRDIEERNDIELQALTALKHLADIMIFLLDLSSNIESPIKDQINLLQEIQNFYPSIEFMVVLTKSDLIDDNIVKKQLEQLKKLELIENDNDVIAITTNSPQGIDNLIEKISQLLKKKVIKNQKFQSYLEVEIDPEFLQDEEELWFLDG